MTTPMPALVLRASEVIGRPVVTLSGELVAEVKDVVFERTGGRIEILDFSAVPGRMRCPGQECTGWAGTP
jgi:sporulation protein YlmC with PRC-barrel domain